MAPMRRRPLALLFGALLVTGCATSQPQWLKEETDACFRPRGFTEDIPRMYWGDPVRDPCWRFRPVVPDR